MMHPGGYNIVLSSKVPKSQVDTIGAGKSTAAAWSSKVPKSQVDTIHFVAKRGGRRSSKVPKSQVDTMDSLKNGIPPAGMPFCYCEKTSGSHIGTSRPYGISRFQSAVRTSFRTLSQFSHLCRSRYSPADTMRSTACARSRASSKGARFQVDTIRSSYWKAGCSSLKVDRPQVDTNDIHDTTSMSKFSKVSKSQVDTIRARSS